MSNLDLALGTARDIARDGDDLKLVTGARLVEQRLMVGLRLFQGEWFAEIEAGVPYYADVLAEAPRSNIIEAIFRREIMESDDIESLKSFAMTVDRSQRKLSLSFEGVSSEGEVAVSEVFP